MIDALSHVFSKSIRSYTGSPWSWRRRQSSPISEAPRRTHSRPPRMRLFRDSGPSRGAAARVESDEHRQRVGGAGPAPRGLGHRLGRLARQLASWGWAVEADARVDLAEVARHA